MIFQQTIVHSGTKSRRLDLHLAGYEVYHQHFSYAPQQVPHYIKMCERAETMYRTPWRVAVSWANHNRLIDIVSRRNRHHWYAQWEEWANFILEYPTVEVITMDQLKSHQGSKADVRRLYEALQQEDYGRYFSTIPNKAINFALDQVARVEHRVPGLAGTNWWNANEA